MIVLAWCLFVTVSFLVAKNQAFLNAPIPAHAAVSSYSIAERRMESNKAIQSVNDNRHTVDSKSDDDKSEETVYVIAFEEGKDEKTEKERDTEDEIVNGDLQNPLDPWSIVWYIGSFGGLVAFFLIVSCSEWCCRRGGRPLVVPYAQRAETNTPGITETPPPPYHLFAPPSYDSVNYGEIVDKTTGEKLDIYVISVPIHRPMMQAPA